MRKTTVVQPTTATWAADSTISVDLQRIGLITHLDVLVEVTPSATLVGANQPDGLWRVMGNMRISGASGTYINLPATDGGQAGTLLHYMGMHDGWGQGNPSGGITAPDTLYFPVVFPIHPGSRPQSHFGRQNPYDLSAFIPAQQESQLTAEWQVYGNDVMDDTVTITSALARFSISRVTGTEAEILQEMHRQQINLPAETGIRGMVPAWSANLHANAGTTSDFSAETIDIITGQWLKRIWLLEQDATATRPLRAADQVTEIDIQFPQSNESLIRQNLETLGLGRMRGESNNEADDAALNYGGAAPKGIGFVDFREFAQSLHGADYGMDLREVQQGTAKIGLLIGARAAGDDTLVLFERYAPYGGSLQAVK